MNKRTLQTLRSDNLFPVYLFYGEEELLREEAINLVVNKSLGAQEKDLNLFIFHGDEIEGNELYNSITSYSMFSSRKCVVVKNCNRLGENVTKLLNDYLDSPVDSTILIFEAEKVSAKNKFFKKLKETSYTVEFKKMYDRQIPGWIKERIRAQGKGITDEAAQLLFEYIGLNLMGIENEINKCIIYIKEKNRITREDIENVVGVTRKYNVYELRKAIGEKNISKATQIISKMIEIGESLPGIIVWLVMYFNIIGKIVYLTPYFKNLNELREKTGINQYFWKDYIQQAKNFSEDSIKSCFEFLLEADYNSKRGYQNDLTIGTLLVYRLCRA